MIIFDFRVMFVKIPPEFCTLLNELGGGPTQKNVVFFSSLGQ